MIRRKLLVLLALASLPASAGPIVYILNTDPNSGTLNFGTIDLATGAFHQIGTPYDPPDGGGLTAGPNGSLLSISFAGRLNSINPATGALSFIGPTGLGDCTLTTSPCGPNSANVLGYSGGSVYATDFAQNLYSVSPTTGHATLIGSTGIPALPFIPLSNNPDGSFNFYDENLFSAGGNLYANFDAGTFNPGTSVMTTVIPDALYRIDPSTGYATLIAATDFGLSAIVGINGTAYAFSGPSSQILTLNLTNGHTTFVSDVDPSVGIVVGAVATPEPATVVLSGLGAAALFFLKRRRRGNGAILPAIIFVLAGIPVAFGQTPSFTPIDYPGATLTDAFGINTRGDVVGNYNNADKSDHGFLLSAGLYTSIDFPGATATEAFTISPRGDIGGIYTLGGVTHGFVLSGTKFTTIDFPGATATEVGAINFRGDILGDYTLAGARHGYLLIGGQFTTIDFPGAANTAPVAFNPQGDVVGGYNVGGVFHGFLYSEGEYTAVDVPRSTRTGANGINARGDISGRYVADGVSHGFLLIGGQVSTIDIPGATFTAVDSMNQRGDLVGRYTTGGVRHGYLLVGFQPGCIVSVPRIFTVTGGAAITHSGDFSLVTTDKPAAAGEALSVFATGFGPTSPSVAPGQPFPVNPLAVVVSPVEVRVNGKPADVLAAVGFPGAVEAYQVNFRVPADTAKGPAAIQISAGSLVAPQVTIPVQ